MKIIHRDGTVSVCPEQEQISVLRHTAAHILAQAVKRLYPQARFAFGPATEQGFYYDVDLGETKLTEAELPAIEEEMRRIIRENYPIKPFVLPRDDALALMRERGEDYKCEHIASLDEETFSFFRQGEYIDLCRGPHLTYTNALKVFRLTGVSGAYWKNDASRPMLTRITGTAFVGQEEMDAYFTQLEEAKLRDHRRIGREMELFLFDDAGAGFPFFLPGGVVLKNTLVEYWRSLHKENGYQEISTPQILNSALWKQSGHWAHYQDKMYMTEIDGDSNLTLDRLAFLVCRGGWPQAVDMRDEIALDQAMDYYDAVVHSDINRADNVQKNPERVRRLMRSYARNQGGQVPNTVLAQDIAANDETSINEETVASYVNALRKIFVVEDMPAGNPNLRSKTAIRSSDTRYYIDPSIAVAALGIGPNDLINDLKTFGFLFETLCIRDLRVFADALNGGVYHYRDKEGQECDAVVHLRNGKYGLIEIKLGGEKLIEEGAASLKALSAKIDTDKMYAPSFLMVLTGTGDYAYRRQDGVFVVPIGCLKN